MINGKLLNQSLATYVDNFKNIYETLPQDKKDRSYQIDELRNLILSQLRILEFSILVTMYDNNAGFIQDIRIRKFPFNTYGKLKEETVISVKYTDIQDSWSFYVDCPYMEFDCLDYVLKGSSIHFRLKKCFRRFDNERLIKYNPLYERLFGLGYEPVVKTLYLYLSRYTFDFLQILSENFEELYKELQEIDLQVFKEYRITLLNREEIEEEERDYKRDYLIWR